jgi:hypothetical protein
MDGVCYVVVHIFFLCFVDKLVCLCMGASFALALPRSKVRQGRAGGDKAATNTAYQRVVLRNIRWGMLGFSDGSYSAVVVLIRVCHTW